MPNLGPQVSVFHFTSKISKAKIRKYKLATERGMVPAHMSSAGSAKPESSTDGQKRKSSVADDLSTGPPAKKPKLRLRGPKPVENPGESISVSRPKREAASRPHYSELIEFVDETPAENANDSKLVLSSGLPEPTCAPVLTGRTSTASKPAADTIAGEDYGDFSMYYIDPVDDDPTEKPNTKRNSTPEIRSHSEIEKIAAVSMSLDSENSKHSKPLASGKSHSNASRATAEATVSSSSVAPLKRKRPRQHRQSQGDVIESKPPHHKRSHSGGQQNPVQRAFAPQQRPGPLRPSIRFNKIAMNPKPTKPSTIAGMIKKLQRLSSALSDFGNVRGPPESPSTTKATPTEPKGEVDAFLSHFGDEDDEYDWDRALDDTGTPDEALTYGIGFIQNALESWARNRLATEALQQFTADIQQFPNASGKTSRFDNMLEVVDGQEWLTLDLAATPESVAVRSFQEILDSGCLRLNIRLPTELARSLRNLYVQIDHLINQGQPKQPEWRCMSYGAQIQAHETRMRKHMESQILAQAEMIRQQRLAEQQMMMQMGLVRQTSGPNAVHGNQAQGVESVRRRSMPNTTQQTQGGRANGLRGQTGLQMNSTEQSGMNTDASRNEQRRKRSDQSLHQSGIVEMSNADAPPLRQQADSSYKFSFAPTSQEAVKAFGAQAFPSTATQSSTRSGSSTSSVTQVNVLPRLGDSSESPMEIPSSDMASPTLPKQTLPSTTETGPRTSKGLSARVNPSEVGSIVSHANETRAEKDVARSSTSVGAISLGSTFDFQINEKGGPSQSSSATRNSGFIAINAPPSQPDARRLSNTETSSSSQGSTIKVAAPKTASSWKHAKPKIRLGRRKDSASKHAKSEMGTVLAD